MRGANKLNKTTNRVTIKAARKIGRVADKTMAKEEQWSDAAHTQLKKARKQWDHADKTISEYIKENPKKAAAIAAGVGAAVGVAIGAYMRRKK